MEIRKYLLIILVLILTGLTPEMSYSQKSDFNLDKIEQNKLNKISSKNSPKNKGLKFDLLVPDHWILNTNRVAPDVLYTLSDENLNVIMNVTINHLEGEGLDGYSSYESKYSKYFEQERKFADLFFSQSFEKYKLFSAKRAKYQFMNSLEMIGNISIPMGVDEYNVDYFTTLIVYENNLINITMITNPPSVSKEELETWLDVYRKILLSFYLHNKWEH